MKQREEELKIATALGYYARATDPQEKSLSAAIQAHGLAVYQHDVDCQIAFRKGFQEAEKHIRAGAGGPEGEELRRFRRLFSVLERLTFDIQASREEVRNLVMQISLVAR